MAKGNMLLGYARGKVGSLVFKRQNGQQVTVPRVSGKNPRTTRQMLQRIAFSSAVKTAKQLEGIVDHSFQGTPYGAKSVQKFVSLASKEIQSQLLAAFNGQAGTRPFRTAPAIPLAAQGVGAAAPVLISSGDLASPMWQARVITTQGSAQVMSPVHIELATGITSDITAANYEQVIGVPYTDQLTFVLGVVKDLDYISEEELFKGIEFHIFRLNWLQSAITDSTAFFTVEDGDVLLNTNLVDQERSSDVFAVLNGDLSSGLSLDAQSLNIEGSTVLAACIASRYENGTWRRSTQRLVSNALSGATSAIEAQNSYGWNDIDSLLIAANPTADPSEEWYLNKKKK